MPLGLGFFAAAGAGGAAGAVTFLATVTGTSQSLVFANIPNTNKHLYVIGRSRDGNSAGQQSSSFTMRLNDGQSAYYTGGKYATSSSWSNLSTANGNTMLLGYSVGTSYTDGAALISEVFIYDYTNSTAAKNIESHVACIENSSNDMAVLSGMASSFDAVNNINFRVSTSSGFSNAQFWLYGISG